VPLHIRSVIAVFVISTCTHACVGLWQFFTQSSFDNAFLGISSHVVTWGGTATLSANGERWLRAYGALPHPNILGAFLLIGIILALYLSVTSKNKKQRIITLLCIGILSAGIIVTFSRTVWIVSGMTLSLLALIVFLRSADRKYMITPLIMIISTIGMMSILLFPLLSARTLQDTRLSHNSITDRGTYAQHAYNTLKTHPLIGTGIHNYTNTVFLLYGKDLPIWYIQPVHNIYILAVVEYGLIGSLFLLFFCFHIITTYQRVRCDDQRIRIYSLLIVLAILAIGVFDHWPWSSHSGLMITLLFIGLLLRKKMQEQTKVKDDTLSLSNNRIQVRE
jgi:O-antigen ligase